ncbi:MAG: tRNA (adenosine(37)-N6)-threonylcarbamoyltransferase complex ATPase subunit type 1 TsaE [Pseudobdellovibrionaceae bacterium]
MDSKYSIQKKSRDEVGLKQKVPISSLAELEKFWIKEIASFKRDQTVLWLDGDLGAGKTTSVSLILKFLTQNATVALSQSVSSPTFALHHQYQVNHVLFDTIEHVDLYRIQSDDELEDSGFWDLFSGHRKLMIIEWGSRMNENQIPFDWEFFKYHFIKT